jgi:hypothetical protein
MATVDRIQTLLIADNTRAGDHRRANFHRERRATFRRDLEAAVSIWCGRPVSGYMN